MRSEYEKNDDFVVGLYQKNGKPVHGLKKANTSDIYIGRGPLKSVCGSISGIQHSNPWAEPIGLSDMSNITCERCLKTLRSKGILTPKKDKTVKLLGIYNYSSNFPTHALMEREPRPSENPRMGFPLLRSVCGAHPDVYRSDVYPIDSEVIIAKVTCENCLNILKQAGLVPQPAKPQSDNKFFLVEYTDEALIKFTSLKNLKEEVRDHNDVIVSIMVINSYDILRIKNTPILVNKNGKEITEKDL